MDNDKAKTGNYLNHNIPAKASIGTKTIPETQVASGGFVDKSMLRMSMNFFIAGVSTRPLR